MPSGGAGRRGRDGTDRGGVFSQRAVRDASALEKGQVLFSSAKTPWSGLNGAGKYGIISRIAIARLAHGVLNRFNLCGLDKEQCEKVL